MATVSQTLQVQDRFTGPLKSFVSGLKGVTSSTQSTNSALRSTGNATQNTNKALNATKGAASGATKELANTGKAAKSLGNSSGAGKMSQELQRAQKMALLSGRAFREAKKDADALGKAGSGASASEILKANQATERLRQQFRAAKSEADGLKSSMSNMSAGGMVQAAQNTDKLANSARKTKSDTREMKNEFNNVPTGGVQKVKGEVRALGDEVHKTGGIFKSVLGANIVTAGITKGFGAINNSMDSAIQRFDTLNNAPRVLNAMGFSAKDAGKSSELLKDGIDGLPTKLQDITTHAQGLSIIKGNATEGARSALAMNNALLSSGATTEKVEQGMYAYNNAMAVGKMELDQYKTLTTAMPGALQKVSKAFGVAEGDTMGLFKKLQSGEVTMKQFDEAMIKASESTGGFADTAKTATKGIGTSLSNLRNTVSNNVEKSIRTVNDALKSVGKGEISDQIDKLKGKVGDAFGVFNKILSNIIPQIVSFIDTNQWLFKSIGNIVKALAPVAGAFLVASGGAFAFNRGLGLVNKAMNIFSRNKVLTMIFLIATGLVYAYQNFDWFKKIVDDAGQKLLEFGKWISKTMGKLDGMSWSIKGLIGVLGTLGAAWGVKKLLNWVSGMKKVKKAAEGATDATEGVGKGTEKMKKGFASLQKMAGIALVIGSVALLAKTMEPLAKTGADGAVAMLGFGIAVGIMAGVLGAMASKLTAGALGIAVFSLGVSAMAYTMAGVASTGSEGAEAMLMFGLVVGGLALVLGIMGGALTTNAIGIAVFAGAVSLMAFAMAPIAQSGREGADAMLMFGLVVGGLALVLGLLGPLLTAGAVGIGVFGLAIAAAGWGMGQAAPLFEALPPVIDALGNAFVNAANAVANGVSQIVGSVSGLVEQIGNSISQIVDSVSNGLVNVLKQAGESISQVFESIGTAIESVGSGIQKILDGVANVIESVGRSAEMAGNGFKLMAEGVDMIMQHGVISLGAHLGAVAAGLGKISKEAPGLNEVGQGMTQLGAGILLAQASAGLLASAIEKIGNVANSAKTTIEQLQAAFGNIKVPQIDTSGFVSSMTAMTTATLAAVTGIMSALSAGVSRASAQGLMLGKGASIGVTTGIRSGAPMAIGAMKQLVQGVINAGRSGIAPMRSIGAMIGQGLAAGMNSALGAVTAAANRLVGEAERAARAKAKIHSPSRLMRDEVGRYIGQGMAVGMDNTAGLVEKSANGLVDASVATVSSPNTGDIPTNTAGAGLMGSSYTDNTTTEQADTNNVFNFAPGSIVVQGTEGRSGKSLLEELEVEIREKYNAGLAF